MVWFVLLDICEALEIENSRNVFARLDDNERDVHTMDVVESARRTVRRELNIINESGLYSVIMGSRSARAKPFQKWVTGDVLPSIRKTGGYQESLSEIEMIAKMSADMVKQAKLIAQVPAIQQELKDHSGQLQELRSRQATVATKPSKGYLPIGALILAENIPLSEKVVKALVVAKDVSRESFVTGNDLFVNEACVAYHTASVKVHVAELLRSCSPTSPTSKKMVSSYLPNVSFFISNSSVVDLVRRRFMGS